MKTRRTVTVTLTGNFGDDRVNGLVCEVSAAIADALSGRPDVVQASIRHQIDLLDDDGNVIDPAAIIKAARKLQRKETAQ
jgi:hypothetical protein